MNDVNIKVSVSSSCFILNDLINEIIDDYPVLNNTAISYWDDDLQTYVYCGVIPLNYQITLPLNLDNPTVSPC